MTDFEKHFEKYLHLYLDGRLSEKERIAFEEYLAADAERRAEPEFWRKLEALARAEKLPRHPEGYWEGLSRRIESRLAQEERKSPWGNLWTSFSERIIVAIPKVKYVALVLSVLAIVLIGRHFITSEKVRQPEGHLSVSAPEQEHSMINAPTRADSSTGQRETQKLIPPGQTAKKVYVDLSQLPPADTGALARPSSAEAGQEMTVVAAEESPAAHPQPAADSLKPAESQATQPPGQAPESAAVTLLDKMGRSATPQTAGNIRTMSVQNSAGAVQIESLPIVTDSTGAARLQFPDLSSPVYAFRPSKLKSEVSRELALTEAYSRAAVSEADSLRELGDSTLHAYQQSDSQRTKLEWLRRVTELSVTLALKSQAPEDLLRARLLLNQAQLLGAIGNEQFKACVDSLNDLFKQ